MNEKSHIKIKLQDKFYFLMVEQNCKILIVFLLFLYFGTMELRYWSQEGEMQEITNPENEMEVGGGPLFYLEDKFDRNMKSLKRSGSGNIRLLRKKSNEPPRVGIRLLQI